jgi:hypothetical protein
LLNNRRMISHYPDEEKYRVILHHIGGNTDEEKTRFCKEISDHYGIPMPLMMKIASRCPIVIKKDLPFKKAELLAIAFKSSGASVSVEKKRTSSPVPIVLEWMTGEAYQLDLESSNLRKSPGGAWQVIGRVKNISGETLEDTWILVQLFNQFEELITFEEVPLSINPLPAGMSSPFRVIFEKDLPVKSLSLSFKNATGNPLQTLDKREKREWVEVKISTLSPIAEEGEEEPEKGELERVSDGRREAEESQMMPGEDRVQEGVHSVLEDGSPEEIELHLQWPTGDDIKVAQGEVIQGEEAQGEMALPSLAEGEKISKELSPAGEDKMLEEIVVHPWMDEFRKAIEIYQQKNQDPFVAWFETLQKEGDFESPYHSLLTLLIYARFNQLHPSETALENVERVFNQALRRDLCLEEIPSLRGTKFFSDEVWKDLFFRAISKLQEVADRILEGERWDAADLDRLIRIIPHMTDRNSRWAIRFIHERIPGVIINISKMPVEISEGLYRVASRLGVVNPLFDYYEGSHSTGDQKIQSFAGAAFPEWPGKIEEPMSRLGIEEEGGLCLPAEPRCQKCPFEAFCPKFFLDFNPAEKGMIHRP